MTIGYLVFNLKKYSGAAFQAIKLAKYLSNKYQIVFFNIDSTNRTLVERYQGFVVVTLPKNIVKRLILIYKISVKKRISLFHLHGFAISFFIVKLISNIKLILKTTLMEEDDFITLTKGFSGRLRGFLLRYLDRNVVLSKKAYEINSQYIGENKTVQIPNAVKEYKVELSESKKFCIVGVIHPRKRTYEAIHYFINHYSEIPDTELYIVGPVDKNTVENEFDINYIRKCEELVINSGKRNIIHFTGLLSQDEVSKIYSRCLCMLLFSHKEGMPNVVLEAMANNCVPIVFPLDGVSQEIIDNNYDGFIINKSSEKIELSKLVEIRNKRNPVKKMHLRFSEEIVYNKYLNLYSEILHR